MISIVLMLPIRPTDDPLSPARKRTSRVTRRFASTLVRPVPRLRTLHTLCLHPGTHLLCRYSMRTRDRNGGLDVSLSGIATRTGNCKHLRPNLNHCAGTWAV